ncbi:MAG: DUF309 domain-containing protein [Chthoniobacteraceae bacterium]
MKKSERIHSFVSELGIGTSSALDPCYLGYFKCFNEQKYYEAHDVLEHLWLQKKDENHLYFKGLIQIAGAFVHLQKQYLRPMHPKDGKRLAPASRLFELGMRNLEGYCPRHLHFDVEALYRLCAQLAGEIIDSDFRHNPWNPAQPPQLFLTETDT